MMMTRRRLIITICAHAVILGTLSIAINQFHKMGDTNDGDSVTGISTPVMDESSAKNAFSKYIKKYGSSKELRIPGNYDLKCTPFKDVGWILHAGYKPVEPQVVSAYVGTPEGFSPASSHNIFHLFQKAYSGQYSVEDLQPIIEECIQVFSSLDGRSTAGIISNTGDIPGYQKNPLDSDLKDTIRARAQYNDPDANTLVVILYSYRQTGGIVNRYRFTFKVVLLADLSEEYTLQTMQRITLATHIGDYFTLQ